MTIVSIPCSYRPQFFWFLVFPHRIGCILFGAGDTKTAKILETTVPRAKEIKATFLEQMPALQVVIDKLKREYHITAKRTPRYGGIVYHDGYIKGLDGRPILVPFEKDLLVYALQSDEAIQMGCAYVMIHKWAAERGWVHGKDYGVLIWMHDEVQMECRPELADELGQLGCRAIRWAGEFYHIQCPHDGDYLVGQSWYNTH